MSKYVLSGDFGKYESEMMGRNIELTKDDIKTVRFRTRMYDLEEGFVEKEGDGSYLVELEDKQYLVGAQGKVKSFNTSKTSLLHKLACYTAITQFLEPGTDDNEIYMVLACPLSVLQIQEAKEEYKSFLKGKGPISIKVNGESYNFEIKDIMIKAEGSGILYLEPNLFKDKTTLIVDLGGLNLGGSLYINKSCKKEDRFIEECGSDRLLEIVREQLSIYRKGNLVDDNIAEKALNENGIKKGGIIDSKSTQYIEKAKQKYYEEVMNNIKKHKIDVDAIDRIVFVGGTSLHIKSIIENSLPHSYVPDNSQLATVEGLYKVAYKKYGSDK